MFKFTIRELLLLTLVVALGVAWRIDRSRLVERLSLELRNVKLLIAERDIERKAREEVIALYEQARHASAPNPPAPARNLPRD
jgi:hypothetical protein